MRLNAKQILVPVNGDRASESTFRWACQTAKESKAELHAVYVIEVPLDLSMEAEITEDINRGEEILARIEAIGTEEKCKGVQAKILRARHAGPAVVMETEDRHMDLIIMGIPYRRRFGSCHMGVTADYIFHNAACQIIFWREPAPSPKPTQRVARE
jgi:nucleotide-binding universal stress UspA family protein